MRIAIVANTAWNLYNFRQGLIRALLQTGHEVYLLAPEDEALPKLLEAVGHPPFLALQHLSRKGTKPWEDYALYRELRGHYRRLNIDLALHYTIKPNIYGVLAAHSVGARAWATVTGLGYSFLSTGLVHHLVKRLYRWAFRRAERVIFQNEDDRQLFLDLDLVDEAKTALVPGSGIRTDVFAPQSKPADAPPFMCLFVGRLLYDKGVREFLEAAAKLKAKHPLMDFYLVGALDEGNPSALDPALLAEYEAKGIVRYMGPSEDVRSWIARCEVLVLPSYREGLPRVMLEGMAMAKPLITTDAPGCRATVKHGENGLLVPIKDAESLAEAMSRLFLAPPELRQAMGQAGRARALAEFDEQGIIKRYLAWI